MTKFVIYFILFVFCFGRVENVEAHNTVTVAKVIAGEAAGEGYQGMLAVANVIHNRMKLHGKSAYQIISARSQFSAFKMPKLMERNYKEVKDIVDDLVEQLNALEDITNGATHYVTKEVWNKHLKNPRYQSWLKDMKVVKTLGNHIFFRELA